MVRKKNDDNQRSSDEAERALVRDASEVRTLIERAQRLLRGESADAIDAALSSAQAADALADEGAEPEASALPDPNVLVSPKARRARAGEAPIEDEPAADEDDQRSLDALPAAFFTTTMGTMLLSQGRASDARAVFERVLARNPSDEEAQRGLQKALLAQSVIAREPPSSASLALARRAQPHTLAVDEGEAKEPDGLLERADPPRGYDVDELRVLPVDPTTLVVFWEVRVATLKKLAETQSIRGELMLRVVTLVRAEDGSTQRLERFEGPVPRVGDWFVWGARNGASHEVSVGVMDPIGFTALLTARPVRTPRGAPAKSRSVVRAKIVLPERTTTVAASVSRIAEVVGPSYVVEALRDARSTVALEGARVVHEPALSSAYLEEPVAAVHGGAVPSAQGGEHWSETAAPSADAVVDSLEDAWFEQGDFAFIAWEPGSSWSLVLRGGGAGSPSAPWSAR